VGWLKIFSQRIPDAPGAEWRKYIDLLFAMVHVAIWMFPKTGVPQNGWFIMENPYLNG